MNKRFTVEDVLNESFYKMPKFLFKDEFKTISSDAKILYTLLKDRHSLSVANGWINSFNQVYLIYTREEMADMLCCSLPTVRKAIKQLKDMKLIEEERQGLNKPNLIFLHYVNSENTKTETTKLGVKESFSQEGNKLSGNKTYINNTNNNKGNETELSFECLIEDYNLSNIEYIDSAIEVVKYYLSEYECIFERKHIGYSVSSWIDILEGIFEHGTHGDTDVEVLKAAIDKHFTTEYKHKAMYYLHNFTGKTKNNRLYEAGVLCS